MFTEFEVGWLRSSGTPLPGIRRYAELVREGSGTEAARPDLLRAHEAGVIQQVAELNEAPDVIEFEAGLYEEHPEAGTADALWRGGPACAPGTGGQTP
ncbi:hypothetical protein [Umezawaea sp.]|uniref:hypothetical protein n=1 Tax=Umezawaea sp. TaxID=1955258 RepID=UPI002ED20B1E